MLQQVLSKNTLNQHSLTLRFDLPQIELDGPFQSHYVLTAIFLFWSKYLLLHHTSKNMCKYLLHHPNHTLQPYSFCMECNVHHDHNHRNFCMRREQFLTMVACGLGIWWKRGRDVMYNNNVLI